MTPAKKSCVERMPNASTRTLKLPVNVWRVLRETERTVWTLMNVLPTPPNALQMLCAVISLDLTPASARLVSLATEKSKCVVDVRAV